MPLDRFRPGVLDPSIRGTRRHSLLNDRASGGASPSSPVELSNSPVLSFHKPVQVVLPAAVLAAVQLSPPSVSQWVSLPIRKVHLITNQHPLRIHLLRSRLTMTNLNHNPPLTLLAHRSILLVRHLVPLSLPVRPPPRGLGPHAPPLAREKVAQHLDMPRTCSTDWVGHGQPRSQR